VAANEAMKEAVAALRKHDVAGFIDSAKAAALELSAVADLTKAAPEAAAAFTRSSELIETRAGPIVVQFATGNLTGNLDGVMRELDAIRESMQQAQDALFQA